MNYSGASTFQGLIYNHQGQQTLHGSDGFSLLNVCGILALKIHMICGCLLDVCSERRFGGKILTISSAEKHLTYVFELQFSLILCNGGVWVAAVFSLGFQPKP